MSNIYLLSACSGKNYRVTEIVGGHGVQKRLQDLGIVPGIVLEVIQNDTKHPLLIRANGTVLMIGKGIARKISVLEITDIQQDDSFYAAEKKTGDYQCHS